MNDIARQWQGQLIVSCQAAAGEPLHGAHHVAALACAAQIGGAAGIRTDGPDNIGAITQAVSLPTVASFKIVSPGSDVFVTPTFDAARQVVEAGADVVGIDATGQPRPGDLDAQAIIQRIKQELGAGVMADVSTLEEALVIADAGADFITTALAGFTPYSRQGLTFDFQLLEEMVAKIDIPIVAEGRINTPQEAAKTLACGAKGHIAGMAHALITLKDDPPCQVVLAAVMGEEKGGLGSKHLAAKDPNFDAVIVGESTQLDIAISQKGHIGIFLDFIGKASHPTKADLHANPVFHLAKVMDFLQLFAQRVLHNRQGSFVVLEVSAGEKGVLTPPR